MKDSRIERISELRTALTAAALCLLLAASAAPALERGEGPARMPGEIEEAELELMAGALKRADGALPPPLRSCELKTPGFVVTGSETTASGDEHCFPGDGAGNFGPRSDIPGLGIVDGMDVADMDGDGDNDFLACDGIRGEVYLYTQGPAGDFSPTVVAGGVTAGTGQGRFCTYLRIADFDEDGELDFVVGDTFATRGIFVHLQGPPGTFHRVLPGLDLGWASRTGVLFGLAAGDVDADGRDDVVVLGYRGAGAGQVRFYRGDGSGGMAPPVLKSNVGADFPVVSAPTGMALFDLEGDGDLDLIVGGSIDGSHYVYTNDGAGNFLRPRGPVFSVHNFTGIDAFDFDGDGDDDLMLVDWTNRKLLSSENLGGALGVPVPEGTLNGDSVAIGAPPIETRRSPGLDHFKCYRAESDKDVGEPVVLSDAFDSSRARVRQAYRFCAPVEKIHDKRVTPIRDRDAHLELYRIDSESQLEPGRVTVENQFGNEQRINVGPPALLAVPTQKLHPGDHPPPEGLDHLQCYEAEGQKVGATLKLNDQFGSEPGLRLLEPRFWCTPAEKAHGTEVSPVRNPDDHLLCYRLAETLLEARAKVSNQFGEESLGLEPADLLCVPSVLRGLRPEPNITKLCGITPAADFDGGIVAPGKPGTGLLRVDPDAKWPDGRPRRPCGAFVPIDGYLPSSGVEKFRVAYREHTQPAPAVDTAPGIHTRWILDDNSADPKKCEKNPGKLLETTGSLAWMNARRYLEARNGKQKVKPGEARCPNRVWLSVWDSARAPDPNGHYVLWLEWEDSGGVKHKAPFEHHVQLDNKAPALTDMTVKQSDGKTAVVACGEAKKEKLFKVAAKISDQHYWGYKITVSGGRKPFKKGDPKSGKPVTVSFPLRAEDPDRNGWHDYYEGTVTGKTGTSGANAVFLRDVDMTALGDAFVDCCYLLRLDVRDAAILHRFNHRQAVRISGGYDAGEFIVFSASPP